jgi:uncharacterized protein
MRWENQRRSDNVEDRRQSPQTPFAAGGMGLAMVRFLPLLLRTRWGRYLLLGGIVVYAAAHFLGVVPQPLEQNPAQNPGHSAQALSPEDETLGQLVSVVLASTEDTWHSLFSAAGKTYREPKLVLFRGQVQSACGHAEAAMGPFYCPGDHKLYIDLGFYQTLKHQLGAPGDFAQAYVIAHEVGHHVQTLLGISEQVNRLQQGQSPAQVNALSVKQELQADCFAGIWGFYAKRQGQFLEMGDLEEALTAASAIGDDRLQQQAGRPVRRDTFTHGSAQERVHWFKKGFEEGTLAACDTFKNT